MARSKRCSSKEAIRSGEVQLEPSHLGGGEAQAGLSLWKPEFRVPSDCPFQDTACGNDAPVSTVNSAKLVREEF